MNSQGRSHETGQPWKEMGKVEAVVMIIIDGGDKKTAAAIIETRSRDKSHTSRRYRERDKECLYVR